MLLFAHRGHVYEDRATHSVWQVGKGTYTEIPDAIGQMLLRAHPDKLCDVTGEAEPEKHSCDKTPPLGAYMDTVIQAPPVTTRLSAQKRKMLREAKQRSRRARMGVK